MGKEASVQTCYPEPEAKWLRAALIFNEALLIQLMQKATQPMHILRRCKPAKKSSPNQKSYRQKKSIAKQRRQSGLLGRLK